MEVIFPFLMVVLVLFVPVLVCKVASGVWAMTEPTLIILCSLFLAPVAPQVLPQIVDYFRNERIQPEFRSSELTERD